MTQTKQGDLPQVVGKGVQVEAVEGSELGVRRAARADEVRVIGVRQPVRVGAGCREHGLLLQREGDVRSEERRVGKEC